MEIETKIKYNESIIRHLFLVVKEHNGADSSLLIESKNKKSDISESVSKTESEELVSEEPKNEDVAEESTNSEEEKENE